MQEVYFTQITLDGNDENNILLMPHDFSEIDTCDLFHFEKQDNLQQAGNMCRALNDERTANMNMLTGYDLAHDVHEILFKADDSSRCFVFSFKGEQDFKTACELAFRFWELASGYDLPADET